MKNLLTQERGFSLVEILISIVILSTAIIGIIAILPQGMGQVNQSNRISTLNHLAQQKMDVLRARFYTHNDLLAGDHPSTGLGDAASIETNSTFSTEIPSGYYRKWFVKDNDPTSNFKRVTVEVGYNVYSDAGSLLTNPRNNLTVKVSTYIAK